MGLKELKGKMASYKRKRERALLKQIAKNKVVVARKIGIEKKKVELAEERQKLQKLKQKSSKGSAFAGLGKSFQGFRQFATDYTEGHKTKTKTTTKRRSPKANNELRKAIAMERKKILAKKIAQIRVKKEIEKLKFGAKRRRKPQPKKKSMFDF